jgi:two-component system sensor kinase FixL
MRLEGDEGRVMASVEETVSPAAEPDRRDLLVREQAAAIAHYKKMYDRSSALARIGVWEYDLVEARLTWTDGVYDLFELPRGSHLDRAKIVALYEEESRRDMERMREQAIEFGGNFTLDIRIRTAKGNQRWLRLTADVERENGRSLRIFGTKQDITEEKAAQAEVRALQAELIHVSRRSAMGAMAATLAHELNQPLAAISNYVAGVRHAMTGGLSAREALENGLEAIDRCASRAGGIIRSFRSLTDGSAVKRQSVDPNPLIREAGSLALAANAAEVDLGFELEDDVLLSVDPVQFQQVLINLIKNAVEAVQLSPRREILVSSALARGVLAIRVDDRGHGIPAEMMESLFESVVSSKPEGMGIGLSVSRTIVEAHGGKISAANRKGGGASFRVELPLNGPVQAAGARNAA